MAKPQNIVAAKFYNLCRSKGIQGSHIDLLICSIAVRLNMEIYTEDKDFQKYKKYVPIDLYRLNYCG